MILTKEIEVTITPKSVEHYIEKIGYKPNYYIDKDKRRRLKKEKILVNVSDLPKGSNYKVDVECSYCGKIHKKNYFDAIQENVYCSKKCLYENQSEKFLKEFEVKINEDAKTFLEREYIQNKKSFRQISIELFGNDGYRNSLAKWCDKLNIKKRHGSEAVETQWINNPERRKQNAEVMRKALNIEGIKKNHTVPELRKTSEYQEWRLKVYSRDDFTCVKCGKKRDYSTKLNAHHLNSFMYNEESRYDVDNGVTLCQSCHMKFHSNYSNRNNTKEQFEEFLKTK